MQKDFVVKTIGSVTLDPTHSQIPVRISHITKTIIDTADGKTYTINGGYLDIGIIDTMKDLIVNFIGAAAFSVIGYFSVKYRDRNSGVKNFANDLMLRTLSDEELLKQREEIDKRLAESKEERTNLKNSLKTRL